MKFSSSRFDFVWEAPDENIKTYTKDGRFVREDKPIQNLRLSDDGTIASEAVPFTLASFKQSAGGIEELIEFPVVDNEGRILVPPPAWLPDDESDEST